MKKLGNVLTSLVFLLLVIFVIIILFKGAQFVAALLAPLTVIAPTLIGAGVVLLVLSFIPGLKAFCLKALYIVAFVLSLLLLIDSAFIVLDCLHWIWLVVGVLLCGVGLVPIAMIACLISQDRWPVLVNLLMMAISIGVFRWFVARSLISACCSCGGGSVKNADVQDVK